MEIIDISPELLKTILITFHTDNEKELTRQIVNRFVECGLPVKVKQYYQQCMKGTFRILCYIKKSAETVIINNKGMGHDGVSFQVRIDDKDTLDNLDNFSENIKKQILNAHNCGHCSSKCGNKQYVFTYQGNEYMKCRFLCSNFHFQNIKQNDIEDLMDIINKEIIYGQTRKK